MGKYIKLSKLPRHIIARGSLWFKTVLRCFRYSLGTRALALSRSCFQKYSSSKFVLKEYFPFQPYSLFSFSHLNILLNQRESLANKVKHLQLFDISPNIHKTSWSYEAAIIKPTSDHRGPWNCRHQAYV